MVRYYTVYVFVIVYMYYGSNIRVRRSPTELLLNLKEFSKNRSPRSRRCESEKVMGQKLDSKLQD